MMKHEIQREGSPFATDLPMTPSSSRRNEVMRCINGSLKPKGTSPISGTPPRSPISRAFDFLPWSWHRKHPERIPNDKKDEIHYKNIFRNGAIIRDILADKSNKNKVTKGDLIHKLNTPASQKRSRRLSRNKSLDIDELIKKVEQKHQSDEETVATFLDDTFIENIIKSDTEPKDFNRNTSSKNLNSQKHILFNDENVVYLIKKEKPVMRPEENPKDKLKSSLKLKNEENNNNIYAEGSVIKARLKFKKVPSQDDNFVIKEASGSKRGILSRYNSMDSHLPSQDSVFCGNFNKPSETIPEDDSTIANGNSKANGNGNHKSQMSKTRKKLSFRDPVVSQRRNAQSAINSNNNKSANQGTIADRGAEQSSICDSDLESQAMRIVRTVGQAFEVCHKFNLQKNSLENHDERSDLSSSDILDQDRISEQLSDDDVPKKERIPVTPELTPQRPNHLEILPQTNKKSLTSGGDKSPSSPISTTKEIQELKEQLEQQAMQTRQALSQLMLVREQLISETNARIEAQARTQQLLQQNRELLEHLASLGGYVEPNQTGLTTANIALAPQSQLQMLLQDQTDLSSPMRKAFLSPSNNNNLASISQQLNNLGSINQQLTTLSHQLNGLNQQSQNLQNFQNLASLPLQSPPAFSSLSQIQNIGNKLSNLSSPNADIFTQNELFQVNQELLNRLQTLNLGMNPSTPASSNGQSVNNNNNNNNNSSPHNSFFFANPGNLSSSPNSNSNFNFLSSPSSVGNLTPSPINTLNRNSYSNSPMDDNMGLSIDKNLNNVEESHFIKPLSQVGTLTTLDTDGKVKVIVPVSNGENSRQEPSSPSKRGDQNFTLPSSVMLKVTDEAGNVTNSRRLSATPNFITRSTSEKVPNRSQIMSQVQRTAWARHTTK